MEILQEAVLVKCLSEKKKLWWSSYQHILTAQPLVWTLKLNIGLTTTEVAHYKFDQNTYLTENIV